MSIHDNDDDLFDYDPDNEVSSTTTSAKIFDHETEDGKNHKLIEDIKQHYDDRDFRGPLDGEKVRLAIAFHHAFNHFVEETRKEAFAKSMTIALNTLTNGDFNLLKMFHELEMKISRRMYFLELSHAAFDHDSETSIVKSLEQAFSFNFSDFYIRTSYLSTLRICEHAIQLDRATYMSLSKHLGIPVRQELFSDWRDASTRDPHPVYLEDFVREQSHKIRDRIMDDDLFANLEQMLGRPMKVVHIKKES